MSRTALFGLFVLALGIALFVRWNSRAERAGERAHAQPAPPVAEHEAPVLSAPVPSEEASVTPARSPAEAATEAAAPVLTGPLAVAVRVLDPERRPLTDAHVSLFADQQESAALFSGRTGADGTCRVPAPDRTVLARVEHAGFLHKHVWIQGTDPLEIELARAVRLAGSVRDAVTRAPVAGAAIWWQLPRGRGCEECPEETVVSDVRGNYAIAELEQASESVYFWVEAEGYPRSYDTFMTAGGGLALEHDFELRRGLELAGVVLDHATGAPLQGAAIGESGGWATSDGAGRFRLLAGGTGTTRLYVELVGYCGLEIPVSLEAREPVRIRMVKRTALAGRVHDTEGRALAGVKISAPATSQEDRSLPRELGLPTEWNWFSPSESLEAVSDADGAFTLAGLTPFQERQRVSADLEGYRGASLILATGAPGETRSCELVLEPESSLGTIHGRLTLNGNPASATVHWQGPTRNGGGWARDGEYRLEDVEPGRVELSVRLEGSSAVRDQLGGSEAMVEVTPGAELEQDFALAMAVAEISGSVRFEDGTPLVGQLVQFRGAQRIQRASATDEEGRYRCNVPLDGGPYTLTTSYAGENLMKADVPAGTSGADFVLPPHGELRYRAIDAGTGLAVIPWANWRRAGEHAFHLLGELGASPDAGGWFHAALPVGRVELVARSEHHHWTFASDVLIGPASVEHVFELEPGHTRAFELDPASGAWPKDHALVVVEPEAAPSIAGQVSPEGQCRWTYGDRYAPGTLERRRLDFAANARVSLNGLAGRQLLLVFPDDLVLEPAELVVDGPRPEPVTVRWRRK